MFKSWKHKVITTAFVIALLSLGFAGGQYYLKRAYQRQVEVGFNRAFGELGAHFRQITDELSKARLAVSDKQRSLIAANLRRLIYAAQSNIGELPQGESNLERISHLLDDLYEQSYNYVQGEIDATKLNTLHEQVKYLNDGLGRLLVYKENKPLQVSLSEYFSTALVIPEFMQALTILDGELEEYKLPILHEEIEGENILADQAIEAVRLFSGKEDLNFQVTNETKGIIPSYTVEAMDNSTRLVFEVAQKGGMILWMTTEEKELLRSEGDENSSNNLDLEELVKIGIEFLEQREFGSLHLTDLQALQNRVTLTFVPIRDGILRYAEPLRIQINSADGGILGFWATPFFIGQGRTQREIALAQEVTWNLADKLQTGVEIMDKKLALIQNESLEEILTTRLGVKYEEDFYLVYLNLKTGEEERIVRVNSSQFF